ncbi:MAG: bifunctional UDP-N-acetylglucosamine diphosphorylase/glucosamine-1-phosphate N-acetyltransferase GlmU [Vicinamibacterales bacterium]
MTDLHVVILAAGKGTRMKSGRPKVLHELAGSTLIDHVLDTAAALGAKSTVLVVGHEAELVRQSLSARPGLDFVIQSPQLGTGHALLQTAALLESKPGTVLLLYADVPLLQSNTLVRLLEQHTNQRAAATILTVEAPDPDGYGRIVRDHSGAVVRIVEDRDASVAERAIHEINSGIYALDLPPLFDALRSLATDNAQGEYYLTDLVALYHHQQLTIDTLCFENPEELRGVNTRVDLAELGRALLDRKRRSLMLGGVTLEDPSTTYVEAGVLVGEDTIIGPGVRLTGRTSIGARCRIHAGSRITSSTLGDDVTVLDHCVVVESAVEAHASIGPFAHLRPGSDVGAQARVGNFVELKKTRLGPRSKANHLAYLGDATIGADVNIGAGVITCNYDGVQKHHTLIDDGVFIGSDSQLIAPVTIGKEAYVGAGSSITENVPPGGLAVARARQTNKEGWAASRRRAHQKKD